MNMNAVFLEDSLQDNLSKRPCWITWGLAIFTVGLAFLLHVHIVMTTYHSDVAVLMQIGRDVIQQGMFLPSNFWIASEFPSPMNSPMLLYGLVYYVTGHSGITLLFVGVLSFVGIFIAFWYLLKPLDVYVPYALVAFSLLFPFDIVYFYWYQMFWEFICIGLYVRIAKREQGKFDRIFRYLMPLIAFSHGFGTLRYASNIYIPLLVAVFWTQVAAISKSYSANPLKWIDWKKIKFDPLLWMICCFLGYLAFKGYCYITGFSLTFERSAMGMTFANITEMPLGFLDGLYKTLTFSHYNITSSDRLFSINGMLFAFRVVLLVVICRLFRSLCREKSKEWKSALSCGIWCFAAVIAIRTFTGILAWDAWDRYFYPGLLLFILLVALVLEYVRRHRGNVFFLLYLCCGVLLLSGMKVDWKNYYNDIRHPGFRRYAVELKKYLQSHGITRGYASWNNAYAHSVAVDDTIAIASFHPDLRKLSPYYYFTNHDSYSPAKNVIFLLTDSENSIALSSPFSAALLRKAKKLDSFQHPIQGFHVYLFEDNPFVLPEFGLKNLDDSFRMTALYPSFVYGNIPEFEGESAWFREGGCRGVFGPYLPMPAGKYDFEIRGCIAKDELGAGLNFDVVDQAGGRVHAAAPLSKTDVTVVRDVIIPEGVKNVEFRIFAADPKVEFRFDSITITKKE